MDGDAEAASSSSPAALRPPGEDEDEDDERDGDGGGHEDGDDDKDDAPDNDTDKKKKKRRLVDKKADDGDASDKATVGEGKSVEGAGEKAKERRSNREEESSDKPGKDGRPDLVTILIMVLSLHTLHRSILCVSRGIREDIFILKYSNIFIYIHTYIHTYLQNLILCVHTYTII